MGINQQSLKAILAEHKYLPIEGNVLLIGRSTVCLTHEQVNNIFAEYDLPAPSLKTEFTGTKHHSYGFCIDDRELILSLSEKINSVDVLDVSDYEGANIICDLNYPVHESLYNKYDFIYDSSVLDNVFNPASFLVNLAAMLSPRGRAILINVASFFPGALTSVHPEWLYGFFAVNKFHDCKVYLTEAIQKGMNRFCYDTDLWIYGPNYTPVKNYDYIEAVRRTSGICHTLAVVEKHEAMTSDLKDFTYPINLQYINSSSAQNWPSPSYHVFDSCRPLMKAPRLKTPAPSEPHLTDHYKYLGSDF